VRGSPYSRARMAVGSADTLHGRAGAAFRRGY
jgi:hypothetical protein